MRVLLAGATGAIGRPLVDRLLVEGHDVVGTTRSAERGEALRAQGVEPVVLDVFDADAVHAAVRAAAPEVLVHQLTALPQDPSPKAMAAGLEATSRLRRETVPTFVAAARAAGVRRVVVQSISFITAPDGRPMHDEDAALGADTEAVATLEAATTGTDGIEGVVLRYGFFYGPGTWYAPDGALCTLIRKRRYPLIGDAEGRSSFVHVDDAVDATVRALDRGAPGIYNVTSDEAPRQAEWLPEVARLLGAKPPRHVPVWLARRVAGATVVHYATTLPGNANDRARAAFSWQPRPWRDGFAEVLG